MSLANGTETSAPLIEPRTRAAAVTEKLRSMIISGELPPGTRLRQVDIAQRFSVSTTPVREAFSSLAREGFVRHDAHRGVEVFCPTVDEIRENYEIRLALEPLAAQLATERIEPDELSELKRLLELMDAAEQMRLGTELNRRFHFTIYRAAGRPLLLEMIERLRQSADAYVQLLVSQASAGYRDSVRDEHRAILDALEARSPQGARRAMERHLQHNLAEISKLVRDDG